MKSTRLFLSVLLLLMGNLASSRAGEGQVKEKVFEAPNNVKIKLRMEGPYTADVPLQVVCYFKYTPEGAKKMTGAPVELDKRLGGVIGSLRERGEFVGNRLETLLIIPPQDSIKAKALLLVGLGDEDSLSVDVMEQVGTVALREAARLGVNRVAFAPLIRDQGDSKLPTGDVETAVLNGILLAYDTDRRLQKEGLAKAFTLEEWEVEAGSAYFEDTAGGVQKAIDQTAKAIRERGTEPFKKTK